MYLKFPNARLYIHELLSHEKLTGGEAIARAACDFGLIPVESLLDVQTKGSADKCQCMAVAKQIFFKCFEEKSKRLPLPETGATDGWLQLEKSVQKLSQDAVCSQTAIALTDKQKDQICNKIAPSVFDLLLQELNKY
jgi:hypothetical protein